ncbi:MAG TPA: type II toxin-antitoxin system VapC family toxin [Chthoniobacteraceae bacterium]|jgi:predicted nucleic acid-binding protein|nr:type II toxin-antitoxin system VapC family toxin [Chthoniobacteraceae bacterium]
MIVADTCLIASLLLNVPNTPDAEAVLTRDPFWTAPNLWRYEFKNVLATYIRFAGLSVETAIEVFDKAAEIILPQNVEIASAMIIRLASERKLSAYDAEYLALAASIDLKLVTLDKGLLKAGAGIAVTPQEAVAR